MKGLTEVEDQFDGVRVYRQREWAARFPGLTQGITTRAADLYLEPLGYQTGSPEPGPDAGDWERLRHATGFEALARCRQVHGREVMIMRGLSYPTGQPCESDALVTDGPGLLLTITVADCIPVFVVDPVGLILGLAHAGWRGIAAGVVESVLQALEGLGADTRGLHVHLGPGICGDCYEVRGEVTRALGIPGDPRFVDLRQVVAERVAGLGVDPSRVTSSGWCTLCSAERPFYSFRGGDRNRRMAAFLGRKAG